MKIPDSSNTMDFLNPPHNLKRPKTNKHDYSTVPAGTVTVTDNELGIDYQPQECWSDSELEHIATVDLSTPLEDEEDYNNW